MVFVNGPIDQLCQRADAEAYQRGYEEGAKAERDRIYKRLESIAYQDFESGSKIPVVDWPDIDCLFAELKDEPLRATPSKQERDHE